MKTKLFNKNNGVVVITSVLFLSLIFNIYSSLMNSKYKQIIGNEAYKSVKEIRNRNENVLVILDEGIKAGCIAHEQLLMLYKNCNVISDEVVQLWSDYGTQGQNEFISAKTQKLTSREANNDVYLRIQNLIFEYLNMEMKSGSDKLVLNKKMLENFGTMKDMSEDIQNYYNKFIEDKLKNLDEEKRKDKIIKKKYWVDIINGINQVIQSYANYPFIIES